MTPCQFVRGERKFHAARRERSDDLGVVRVETVLAGPEVDRAHGKTFAGRRDLLEAELIDAPGVPVAVGALQIAGVREADAEREAHSFPRIADRWLIARADRIASIASIVTRL